MFWASWGSHLLAAFGLQTFQLLATAITSEIYSMEAPCTASIQHLPASPVHLSSFRGVRQEKLELQNHTISYASAERCTNEKAPQRSNHMHQGCNWYVLHTCCILIQYRNQEATPSHCVPQRSAKLGLTRFFRTLRTSEDDIRPCSMTSRSIFVLRRELLSSFPSVFARPHMPQIDANRYHRII